MKNTISRVLAAVFLVLGMVSLSHAQTATTSTTLSAAIGSTSTQTINVTSATGFTAGTTMAYVDNEGMNITAVNGTTITVRRGSAGIAATHASGATVYVGPLGQVSPFFQETVGRPLRNGSCVRANNSYLPVIGTTTGTAWDCDTLSLTWRIVNGPTVAASIKPNVVSGQGATATLTSQQCGSVVLFDRVAGIVYTLPSPSGIVGCTFTFNATATVTSNAYKIITSAGTIFLNGTLMSVDTDTGNAVAAWTGDNTTLVAISMNGTTTGGLLGTSIKVQAISATQWMVTGVDTASGAVATPFATS